MRLTQVKIKGVMSPFRGATPLEINFDALGRGLVAVVGDNGQGKSTILEAPFAALYRKPCSRNGSLCDYADGNDAFIEAHFNDGPGRDYRVMLSIDADARKIEPYLFHNGQSLTNGRAAPFDAQVQRLFGTRELALASVFSAQNRAGSFVDMPKGQRKQLFVQLLGLDKLPRLHTAAVSRLKRAEELERELQFRMENLQAALATRDAARDAVAVEQALLDGVNEQIVEATANEAAAVQHLETLRRLAAAIEAQRKALTTFEATQNRREAAKHRYQSDVQRLCERMEEAGTEAEDGDEELAAKCDALIAEQESARAAEQRIEVAHANLRAWRAQGATQNSLPDVPCEGSDLFAKCPLISGAVVARVDAAKRVEEAENEHRAACDSLPRALHLVESDLMLAQQAAKRLNRAQAGRERIEEASSDLRRVTDEWERDKKQFDADLTVQKADADGCAKDVERLKAAAAKTQPANSGPSVHALQLRRDAHIAAIAAEQRTVDSLDGVTEQSVAEAEQSFQAAELGQDVWRLITDALSPDGVQALEVDAAGPRVADIANKLLESCWGPRFTIAFETLRAKQDGGMREVFDVSVRDGGELRRIEDLSGGEEVIVGEALNLALAIHNANRSGIRWRTLWRDETAGALSPRNAERYVAMLRAALDIGQFAQVIFVSHSEAVCEAADVRLHLHNGQVEAN